LLSLTHYEIDVANLRVVGKAVFEFTNHSSSQWSLAETKVFHASEHYPGIKPIWPEDGLLEQVCIPKHLILD
jgi:hypothetical protein